MKDGFRVDFRFKKCSIKVWGRDHTEQKKNFLDCQKEMLFRCFGTQKSRNIIFICKNILYLSSRNHPKDSFRLNFQHIFSKVSSTQKGISFFSWNVEHLKGCTKKRSIGVKSLGGLDSSLGTAFLNCLSVSHAIGWSLRKI